MVCNLNSNGSASINATTPITQTLPSTDDGKIYIELGVAYSATNIELFDNHPVYQYSGGKLHQYTPYATVAGSASSASTVTGGSNGQVLISNGTQGTWTTAPWMTNPMTTAGDLILGGASGAPTRLAKGSNGQLLGVDSNGNVTWINEPHTGTVTSVTLVSGTGITVTDSGTAIETTGSRTISLNVATTSTLGGVKVGQGLSINNAGVLTIDITGATEGEFLYLGPDGVDWATPTNTTYTLGTSGNTVTLQASTGGSPQSITVPYATSAGSATSATNLLGGTSGQVLISNGTQGVWSAAPWMTNPMTTSGDLIVGGPSGAPSRLGKGANGKLLGVDSNGNVAWVNEPHTGTVTSVTLSSGTGITVTDSGTAIETTGSRTISLNIATTSALGGVKVGQGLSINGTGVLTIDTTGATEGEFFYFGPDGVDWATPANTTYTLGTSGNTVTLTASTGGTP